MANSALDAILRQLTELCQQLSITSNKLVLAYSGGIDSQVLAYALSLFQQSHQVEVLLCHVHHGLSANADVWDQHCQRTAQALNLPIVTEKVQLLQLPRQSLEAVARDARYQALCSHLNQGDVLLTGHHQDDQLETILLALKRGQGPKGLASMGSLQPLRHPVYSGVWHARPMLGLSRKCIEAIACECSLNHIEDESNQDQRFDRNFIRQTIIPLLKQRWPSIAQTASRSAQICHQTVAAIDFEVVKQLPEILLTHQQGLAQTERLGLNITKLLSQPVVWQSHLLRGFIEKHQVASPSMAQLDQTLEQLRHAKQDAKVEINCGEYVIKRYQEGAYLLKAEPARQQQSHKPIVTASLLQSLSETRLSETPSSMSSDDMLDGSSSIVAMAYFGEHILPIHQANHGVRLRCATSDEIVTIKQSVSGRIKCQPVFAKHARSMPRELKKLLQECQVPPWRRNDINYIFYNDQLVGAIGLWVDKRYLAKDDAVGFAIPLMGSIYN
ncbi:tRNA lysidine(34) synthetase TilS [Shewanella maritima]|uniref:tRNA lysidine(34) synthetase TilS n=1 Tax=Shewanella maritima TaxID=2520507 RepID=UPI00373582E0